MSSVTSGFHHNIVESPIEKLFLDELQGYISHWLIDETDGLIGFCDGMSPFYVIPQYSFERYRFDFLIVGKDEHGTVRLDVEVDGHDFHERTKEQAAHDKRRDRYLQGRGFKVIRFTGSEVFKDPPTCVDEALCLVSGFSPTEIMAAQSQ